ncbi:N-alpha-acetyltransferase 35 NatC auxiliary subunit, partial [Cladochytrium tenue]
MDPKMDTGVDVERSPKHDRDMIADLVPRLTFSCEQILGISDAILCLEVAWMNGGTMANTIFTSFLMLFPAFIKNHVARALVYAALKSVSLVRDEVLNARAFEDDEFVSSSGSFGLAEEISVQEAVGVLQEADDELVLLSKALRGRLPPESRGAGAATTVSSSAVSPRPSSSSSPSAWPLAGLLAARPNNTLLAPALADLALPAGKPGLDLLDALLARLRFRRAFLTFFTHLGKRNIPSARKSMAQCATQLSACAATVGLGRAMPELFDKDLNRKASADLPARKSQSASAEASYGQLGVWVAQLQLVLSVPAALPLEDCL